MSGRRENFFPISFFVLLLFDPKNQLRVCIWTISQLLFSCLKSPDVINVYDGKDSSSQVIGQFCNTNTFVQLISTSNYLFVEFWSRSHFPGQVRLSTSFLLPPNVIRSLSLSLPSNFLHPSMFSVSFILFCSHFLFLIFFGPKRDLRPVSRLNQSILQSAESFQVVSISFFFFSSSLQRTISYSTCSFFSS